MRIETKYGWRALLVAALVMTSVLLLAPTGARAQAGEVRLAAQYGLAYLPLMVMQHERLVEKHARAAGLGDVKASWLQLTGAAAMNDALLAGNLDFVSVGPTPLGLLWARTRDTPLAVKGMAAYCSFPLYLNTRNPAVKHVRDLTDKDRIALPAVKVSGQALALQMAALREWGEANYGRLDPLTVTMAHPDATAQMLSGKGTITGHFTTAPFHQMQMKDPAIRNILKSYDLVGGRASAIMLATTTRFRDTNPKLYAAVLAALGEAIGIIDKDRNAAAALFLKMTNDRRNTQDELLKMLEDPDFHFTLTPERVMPHVEFQRKTGAIKVLPASWKDLFFPEVHHLPGS